MRFEDIPHSMFSAPGRKMVRSQGTTADNVIQYKPDDPSETNFVSEMKEYHGAAGESSNTRETTFCALRPRPMP